MVAAAADLDLLFVVLGLHLMGRKNREIAAECDLSEKKVSRWINEAYDEGLLSRIPHPSEFGVRLDCRCKTKPIKVGDKIVCVNCGQSGWDFHPRMHAKPLPKDRRRYKPDSSRKGGK